MKQSGFGAANMIGEVTIARRLPHLCLEAAKLSVIALQNIIHARQILFGCFKLQLRLMTAGMQTRSSRSFFQNRAAILRLGADQGIDLPLPNQICGMSACRLIGE